MAASCRTTSSPSASSGGSWFPEKSPRWSATSHSKGGPPSSPPRSEWRMASARLSRPKRLSVPTCEHPDAQSRKTGGRALVMRYLESVSFLGVRLAEHDVAGAHGLFERRPNRQLAGPRLGERPLHFGHPLAQQAALEEVFG